MKTWQVLALIGLNAVCLLTAYRLMLLGKDNAQILGEIQAQQNEVYRVAAMQKFRENLLQDIARAAATDPAMMTLLARHGHEIPAAPGAALPANPK
jgi:hypothetical protein